MDFAMDENGDLALKNGDFYFVTGVDATVQFLTQRLRFLLAEWFLDETKGIPYLDRIFIKNPNPVELDSIFKTVVIESPGVLELLTFSLGVDAALRKLLVTGSIRAIDGEADFSETLILPGGA